LKTFYLCVTLALAGACGANAQTYVATTGSDSNSCTTIQSPCLTFNGAIAKTHAGGQVLALDSGDFGPIVANMPVTIDGGGHGAFITSAALPISVSLTSLLPLGPVILRNLSVHIKAETGGSGGTAALIASLSFGGLTLEHVSFDVISQDGYADTGIQIHSTAGAPVILKDVTVVGFSQGIVLDGVSNRFPSLANLQNVFVASSTYGLLVYDTSLTVHNSTFTGTSSSATAIQLQATDTAPISIIDSSQMLNSSSGITLSGGTLRLSNSVVSGNVIGVLANSGTFISFRNNAFAGNETDGSIPLTTSLK
jgi:hypothetical protein